jgi:hypothetical protein
MSENTDANDSPYGARERTPVPAGGLRRCFRRLTRNAWRILFLWLVIFSAIVYGIYRFVEPTYLAYSMIRIESFPVDLFGPTTSPDGDGSQTSHLKTEDLLLKRQNPQRWGSWHRRNHEVHIRDEILRQVRQSGIENWVQCVVMCTDLGEDG